MIRNEQGKIFKNPLIKYAKHNNNLLITPHIGGANYDAWEKTENRVIDKFLKASRYGKR